MIFLNNLNKIFMSKDYPDGQGVSVSASASASDSDSEGSYDGSNSNSGDDKKDSSVISGKVVRPAPSKEPNPLIVEELREDNAEYLAQFKTKEIKIKIGGEDSDFTPFDRRSGLEEVKAGGSKVDKKRKQSESPAAKDPADVPGDVGGRDTDFTPVVPGSRLGEVDERDKAGQKRKKSESPANYGGAKDPADYGGAKDPADLFRAVRRRLLVNKSTQTTPYQGNSPTERLVPAPAPSSPGQGGVGKGRTVPSPS